MLSHEFFATYKFLQNLLPYENCDSTGQAEEKEDKEMEAKAEGFTEG